MHIYIKQGVQVQNKRSRLRSFWPCERTVLLWTLHSRDNWYWNNGACVLRKLEIGTAHFPRACKWNSVADGAYDAVYLHNVKN